MLYKERGKVVMMFWDRNEDYPRRTSSKERKLLAQKNCTPSFLSNISKANTALNIAIPLGIFALCDFNLIALGVGFVATDAVLSALDNLVFVVNPYKESKKMTVEKSEKRIESLKKELEEKEKKIESLRNKYCQSCYDYRYSRNSCTACHTMARLVSDVKQLNKFLTDEEEYINEEQKKAKETLVATSTGKSVDYSDKMEYFELMRDKIEYFVEEKSLKFLNPLKKSMSNLISILKEREVGFTLIPRTLYIYLDELQDIMEKYSTFESDNKETYKSSVKKVASELSEVISNLINRIKNYEVEDFEVNVSVLLKDLEKLNETEKEVMEKEESKVKLEKEDDENV